MQRRERNSWLAALAIVGILGGVGAAQTPPPVPAVDPADPLPRPIAGGSGLPVAPQGTTPAVPGAPVSPPRTAPSQPAGALPFIPPLPPNASPMTVGGAALGSNPMTKSAAWKKVGEMLLEELLQNALHHHAEILSAQSRLREAEMELIRVRQKILVQIATQRAEFESAKALYSEAKVRKDRIDRLFAAKTASSDEVSAMELTLLKHKADLNRAEAALAAAAGVPPPGYHDTVFHFYSRYDISRYDANTRLPVTSAYIVPSPVVPNSVPTIASSKTATASSKVMDKLAKTLATPFKLDFAAVELEVVLSRLQQENLLDDLVVSLNREQLARKGDFVKLKNPIPLGAALQWVEDNYKVRFIVRDYGVAVTDLERVPPGALRAMDIWRQSNQSLQGGAQLGSELPAGIVPSFFPSQPTTAPAK